MNTERVRVVCETGAGGERLRCVKADVLDPAVWDGVVSDADALIHCAAVVSFAAKDPQREIVDVAVEGTNSADANSKLTSWRPNLGSCTEWERPPQRRCSFPPRPSWTPSLSWKKASEGGLACLSNGCWRCRRAGALAAGRVKDCERSENQRACSAGCARCDTPHASRLTHWPSPPLS